MSVAKNGIFSVSIFTFATHEKKKFGRHTLRHRPSSPQSVIHVDLQVSFFYDYVCVNIFCLTRDHFQVGSLHILDSGAKSRSKF